MTDTPVTAKKSLGQHWLRDVASLEAICVAAQVQAADIVLEIGPGQGSLTEVLARHKANIHAIEFDDDLIPALQKKFANLSSGHIQVQQGDIRKFDFNIMPDDYKIVANIPYYLTAHLLRLLTEEKTYKPNTAVLLVQKEVAERVAASPGDMAFISVAAQLYYEVSLGRKVPASLFEPPPKVDSQILILHHRQTPLFPDIAIKEFFHLVKIGFAQRRKTLLNNLISGLGLGRDQVQAVCEKAGIDPTRRAQTLSLNDWHNLYRAFNPMSS